jgi:hypothetical protein
MALDKIVILVLALLFFGGATLLYFKNQRDEKKGGQAPSSAIADRHEGETSNKPQEKKRKISRF